jgi:uncharacterized membrane protein YhdT
MDKNAFTAGELVGIAWVLGIVAVAGWIRIAYLFGDSGDPWTGELGIWIGVAVLATSYSAACVVLVGVKGVALQLAQESEPRAD